MAATSGAARVRVQRDAIDVAAESALLTDGRRDIGALVTFTGLCRDEAGRLSALELEHYPGMAERAIGAIAADAVTRFSLLGLTVIHRYGSMQPGETIVLVAAAASHRQAAFDAASFVMDFLKTDAPFWKKEHLSAGGTGGWVDAREADDAARARWRRDD
ncbi:molybdopterin synthase subunit MoaE [Rhizobium sp. RU20A]|uniref:molybdenum cofactor biosynthesis protein MoaE n=1 Tax=Rhizobium sp. RU20A TaxID=1907412 RepID=UPI000954BC8C|nr:molybdenum cofactor biosynthesis protein MoaE [Rhizobium sp. RU20A]SIP94134.1 molybdopterin synthase subunit MoaE [Rhizobium sp. RU20A]